MTKKIMLLAMCSVLIIPFYAGAEDDKKPSALTEFSPSHLAAQNLRKVRILIRKGDDERAKLYFAEAMSYYAEAEDSLEKTIEQGDTDVNLDIEEERLMDRIRAKFKAAEDDFRDYCWDNDAGTFRDKPNCRRR